jgi:hypothetical protein
MRELLDEVPTFLFGFVLGAFIGLALITIFQIGG